MRARPRETALYAAAAVTYVAAGVFVTELALSWVVGFAWLLAWVCGLPAAARWVRGRRFVSDVSGARHRHRRATNDPQAAPE